jgi:hypothetical protein
MALTMIGRFDRFSSRHTAPWKVGEAALRRYRLRGFVVFDGAMRWSRQDLRRRSARLGTAKQTFGAVLLAAVFAAGCTTVTLESPVETKRDLAKTRALERWELLIKADRSAAYEYLSKGSKRVITRSDFVNRMSKTTFRTAKVEGVECQQELCKVTVRFTYDHPMMKGVGNTAQEDWIIEDGQLWYVWSI